MFGGEKSSSFLALECRKEFIGLVLGVREKNWIALRCSNGRWKGTFSESCRNTHFICNCSAISSSCTVLIFFKQKFIKIWLKIDQNLININIFKINFLIILCNLQLFKYFFSFHCFAIFWHLWQNIIKMHLFLIYFWYFNPEFV